MIERRIHELFDELERQRAMKLAGTVAIVGFPNVGKSTLINRLTATRQAVVHETTGTTRDRKELLCEWNGQQFMLIDTGGVDIADPSPITRQIAEQARTAIREADLVLFVVDARIGVTPGDEELAQILREARKPVLCSRTRSTTRRRRRSRSSSTVSASASRSRSLRSTARTPATCSTRSSTCSRATRRARCPETSDPRRDPRPSERRQVVALQPPRRRGAHDRVGGAGYDAGHDRHVIERGERTFRSSTPRAFAASAVTGRGSSTTPSCARSMRRSAPTWGSS